MEYTLDWLVNPEVFAVNRIAAHSDHKFYANLNEANSNISSLIQNLNGTWKFTWAKNPLEWNLSSSSSINVRHIPIIVYLKITYPVIFLMLIIVCCFYYIITSGIFQ